MWACSYAGDRIVVTFLGRRKGDYILLREPYCLKCACSGVTTGECSWHWDDYGFERIYAMGAYVKREILEEIDDDLLSSHIVGLKQYPRYAIPLGLGLAECVKNRYSELLESDLVVPIPLFPPELKVARDPAGVKYNQSVELSKVISPHLGILSRDVLEKTREQKMKGLSRPERKETVKGLYEVKDEAVVVDKQILLVDDVSTSGATASECAQILRDAGAKTVNVLVAGRNTDTSV